MSNININIRKTTKFKTVRIQLSFLIEPTKKEISARAVLLNMMKQQTKKHPTKALLLNHLHERYNMRLSALPSKIGRVQMLTFSLEFIHSAYTLEENDLFIDAVDLLETMIKEPLLTEKLFLQEKRILEEYFDSIYADKAHYAMLSMLKNMYQDPMNYVDGLGEKDTLKTLSFADIKEAYKNLFNGQVICTVLGDVDEDRAKKELTERFAVGQDKTHGYSFTIKHQDRQEEQVITETQAIKQTNIVMGLQMPVYFDDKDYLKARFLNVLLGGHSESILFKEIREKHNLAYYISSSYDPYHGLVMIQTGIDAKNKDKVISLIKESIKDLQASKISDKVFTQSLSQLKNALIQSQDSQARLTNQATLQSVFNIDYRVEERIKELITFTKEDIGMLAKQLMVDTIYILTGDTDEKN